MALTLASSTPAMACRLGGKNDLAPVDAELTTH